MATSFTTHSAGQVITSADINLIQTAVNALENVPAAPAMHGFVAWNMDPQLASGSANGLSAGFIHVERIRIAGAATVTNLHNYAVTAGASFTNYFLALWDGSGSLLGQTANQQSSIAVAGLRTAPLVTPVSVSAGYYYVGWWLSGSGTSPLWLRAPVTTAATLNANMSTLLRSATTGDAPTTTAPSTLGAQTASAAAWWAAVS